MTAGVTLIALRLVIGFHFLNEGIEKLLQPDPKPFTAPFLENAKGPLAHVLGHHVWDGDGLARLGYQPSEKPSGFPSVNMDATRQHWETFRQRIVAHHGFDEDQAGKTEQVLKSYEELLDTFSTEQGPEVIEYFLGIERRDRYRRDSWRHEVDSMRGQLVDTEAKLRSKRSQFLAQVDAIWRGLERDLNGIANAEQTRRPLKIGRLNGHPFDSVAIDRIVPWFDTMVGLCLISGLMVRFAGSLAVVFLVMVIASQWPGSPGSVATWYQGIELVAIAHLVAVGAGHWGGLDGLLANWCGKCCRSQRGKK